MKPNELNEGYEIAQEDLIAQLGVLILEGRTPLDVKSNIRDCINCDDGLLHHRKEDFVSLWKSCPAMYIEVWLYHHEQFNEKEAMNGHSGYLMIEQWQIEIELNRSSEHGFHCTGKMLIQAIKSKLYFSQLSAWLSLTKRKFPRHTYFRLCQMENKTSLKRFIRAPDFHQFPEVKITPTKELVVSLHSLPHSNIPQDYPMFLWVLADIPTETPHRKSTGKLQSNSEPDSLLRKDTSYYSGLSHGKDYSGDPTHVVRKLEFENRSSVEKKVSDQQIIYEEKDVDPTHSLEISENITKIVNVEHSTSSSEWNFSKYYINKEQPSIIGCKMGRNVSCGMSKREIDNPSLTSTNLMASESPQSNKLFCKQWHCSGLEQEPTASKESFGKYTPGPMTKSEKSLHSNSGTENYINCESKELNDPVSETYRTSTITQEDDEGMCELTQSVKGDYDISSSCRKTHNCNTFASRTSQECKKNFAPLEKQRLSSTDDSKNFGTDFNLECSNREISRKSLLTRDLSAAKSSRHLNSDVSECSHKNSTSKTCDDLNFKETMVGRKLKNVTKVSIDRQRSNSESLRTRNFDETKTKSWSVDEYGGVLHRTSKDIKNILPDVRHVMDEEYEKKLNERLRECCLSNEGCSGVDQELCKRKTRRTAKTGLKNEDNVFSEQKCSVIPRDPSISRYHLRHASTGTLPVFHPSTGLPVSSSPAPFRKTSQKQTVDDTCSPSREASSLSGRISNLSKSAPTLATQSLLVNFEESVLNDRLRPDGVVEGFTAELSASGSKKCLAHVTLPVQAYFFKLSDDNAPSPYMGYISLDVPGLPKKGYHVPKKGTIQLTLFNPNQTVVKVFVVLYDFSDMQPNFQTFLRQKTTSLVKPDGLVDRIHDSLLHYLIHLRFVSSKSGRIYLHTDIRVIFARHPPDQVHLGTTTSGPTDPKYVPRQDTQEEEI